MNSQEMLLEVAFILGEKSELFNNALARVGKELLIDDLSFAVTHIVEDFVTWSKDKNNSTLELLHIFLNELFKDMDAVVAQYWN